MKYEPGTFLYEHDMQIIFIGAFIAIGLTMLWFQFEMTNPQGDVQKALSNEQSHLDSIKSDCKALGKYVLDSKGELLDPIVREARDLYMVNCK